MEREGGKRGGKGRGRETRQRVEKIVREGNWCEGRG